MPTDDQMELIPVLPENVKKIRALIRRRDEHHDQHIDHNKKAKALDLKIWEEVQAAGGKLDVSGKLRLKLAEDEILEVSRGEAKLSCKVKSRKGDTPEEGDDDGEDDDDGETPDAPTRKTRKE